MIEEAPVHDRPAPPPRLRALLIPLAVATIGLIAAGALGTIAFGLIWGALGAAALLMALRLARVDVTRPDGTILSVGIIASAVLSTVVMPDAPQAIDVLLVIGFASAWAPAALAMAVFAKRKGADPSRAVNVGLACIGAAGIALPAGQEFGIITPVESLFRGQEPVFGGGHYAITGLALGLIGVAILLAAVTRLPSMGAVSTVVFLTLYAGAQVGFSLPELLRDFGNVTQIPNFWPPDFDWAIGGGDWWWIPSWEFGSATRANPLVGTIRIAILATVIGCAVALPLAFLASTLTAPNRPSYLIDKGFINLIRTVPDLFWALIFVTAVGAGPFAGTLALFFFSLAIMSKLLSETVDSADPRPMEAAKSTGSRHFPAVRAAVLPQVLPNYVAYGLYVFEINIRASAVIGIVGAGGIGQVLETQRTFFRFDRVLAVIILIFGVVFVIEQISIAVRRRLV
ncbi:MAG TPA: phosphonate ABC transporter, permease protein PhnE [Acidimicrobiia bacterium]|nr:phosphonate ABC transporter, permease protein PhnE [Acidimicrobiia bacterium]